MELVRLIKMFLTERRSKGRVGKNLSDTFPVRNVLYQEYALPSLPLEGFR